jgi:hypothetical protein
MPPPIKRKISRVSYFYSFNNRQVYIAKTKLYQLGYTVKLKIRFLTGLHNFKNKKVKKHVYFFSHYL